MLQCGSSVFQLYPTAIAEEGGALSEDVESLIKELLCLKHLNLIILTLYSERAVENILEFPKLLSITKSLTINFCGSPLNVIYLAFMEQLKYLSIYGSNLKIK